MTPSASPRTPSTRTRGQVAMVNRVAVLRLDCPAPNAWDADHRSTFIEEMARLSADPALGAIVLHGRRLFEAGPSPSRTAGAACFPEVIAAITGARAPVVAAISGLAAGAGLELALACAGRVATPSAAFALPGVTNGRIPMNGAIERLVRLIGVEATAEMLVFGHSLDARAATELGLVDALSNQNLAAFAANFANSGLLPPREEPRRAAEPEVAEAQLYAIRLKLRQRAPDQAAPMAALRALEAAVRLSPQRARAEIQRIGTEFTATPQGQALAHAERGAAKLRKLSDTDALAATLRWPMLREAVHLLDEGASPAQVDRCLTAYGFAEGPFAQADRLGLAAVFTRGAGLATSDDWLSYSSTLDLMADAGRHGGAAASGWYRRCAETGAPGFDAEIDQLLQASATFQRLHRSPIADELVVTRCLYAAINGAAALLDQHPELDAEVLDAIWTDRLGFPRWKGGPLCQARVIGLESVVATLGQWRARRNTAGPPSDVIVRLAAREGATRSGAAAPVERHSA